jgi:3-methylfumaryl-CoA hydratase
MSEPSAPLDAATVTHLQTWVGRSETHHDWIHAAPLRGLHALLAADAPAAGQANADPDLGARTGDAVSPLARWLYFLPTAPQSQLASDGHPHKGGFLPPVPLPRRMWAGGRLQWEVDNPLRVGDQARLVSTVKSVSHKAGRSGELVFVVVEHLVYNQTGLCLSEEQDLVYRSAPAAGQAAPEPTRAPTEATWVTEHTPTPPWLFRYSALTFNAHRIHYDRPYATEVEGYAGLVVHGPLIATLLVEQVRRALPHARIERFAFKAVRPTLDLHPFEVCAKVGEGGEAEPIALWAQDHQGLLTMQGELQLAPPL